MLPGETVLAVANEPCHEIVTMATVVARLVGAIVDVDLTVGSSEADGARATIAVDLIHAVALTAWVGGALVDVLLAVDSLEAWNGRIETL